MRKVVDVTVTGRVQGVSFRWATEREADRRGVHGWVRNQPDGSVTAHLEGEPDAVDALVSWLYDGPPAAQVDSVDVRDGADEGFTAFDVRG